jgi:hypothetical protein
MFGVEKDQVSYSLSISIFGLEVRPHMAASCIRIEVQ